MIFIYSTNFISWQLFAGMQFVYTLQVHLQSSEIKEGTERVLWSTSAACIIPYMKVQPAPPRL